MNSEYEEQYTPKQLDSQTIKLKQLFNTPLGETVLNSTNAFSLLLTFL